MHILQLATSWLITPREGILLVAGMAAGVIITQPPWRGLKFNIRPKSIQIVGDVYLDMIAKVGNLPQWDGDTSIELPIGTHAGGSALNTAVQLTALLNTRTTRSAPDRSCILHSLIGEDLYGQLVTARIKESGVQLSAPRAGGQGVCICLSGRRDRAFVSYKGTVARFSERDIDLKALLSPDTAHAHFAAYYDCVGLQPALPQLMRRLRSMGATVSLVPQADPSAEWGSGIVDLLPLVNVLICNQAECVAIAGTPTSGRRPERDEVEAAVRLLLDKGVELVVVTLGDQGALAASASQRWEQRTVRREAVDATGAGDAFAAGFLFGWCCSGDVPLGLEYGCACGAAAVGQMGGSTPLAADEVNKWARLFRKKATAAASKAAPAALLDSTRKTRAKDISGGTVSYR